MFQLFTNSFPRTIHNVAICVVSSLVPNCRLLKDGWYQSIHIHVGQTVTETLRENATHTALARTRQHAMGHQQHTLAREKELAVDSWRFPSVASNRRRDTASVHFVRHKQIWSNISSACPNALAFIASKRSLCAWPYAHCQWQCAGFCQEDLECMQHAFFVPPKFAGNGWNPAKGLQECLCPGHQRRLQWDAQLTEWFPPLLWWPGGSGKTSLCDWAASR